MKNTTEDERSMDAFDLINKHKINLRIKPETRPAASDEDMIRVYPSYWDKVCEHGLLELVKQGKLHDDLSITIFGQNLGFSQKTRTLFDAPNLISYVNKLKSEGKESNDDGITMLSTTCTCAVHAARDLRNANVVKVSRSVIDEFYSDDFDIDVLNAKLPSEGSGIIDIAPNGQLNRHLQVIWTLEHVDHFDSTGVSVDSRNISASRMKKLRDAYDKKKMLYLFVYDVALRTLTDIIKYDVKSDVIRILLAPKSDKKGVQEVAFATTVDQESEYYQFLDTVTGLSTFIIGYYKFTVVKDNVYTLANGKKVDKQDVTISQGEKDDEYGFVTNIDVFYGHNIIVNRDIPVQGHFRLQPCGPGRTERKKIWISDFKKHGYHRRARVLKEVK